MVSSSPAWADAANRIDAPRGHSLVYPFQAAAAGLATVLIAFPTVLSFWALLACLMALLPASFIVHCWSDRDSGRRKRLLGPLVLFTVGFVVILGSRALLLGDGGPGRFFVIDSSSGQTMSVSIQPPELRERGLFNSVRNPSLEGSIRDWGTPYSNARSGFRSAIARTSSDHYIGRASAEARVHTGRGATYIAIPVGAAFEAKADVRPGAVASGSLAVKLLDALPRGARLELRGIYYNGAHEYVSDEPLSGRGSIGAVTDPQPRRWHLLYGTSTVPKRASFANLLLLARGFRDEAPLRLRLDAALFVPAAASRADFRAYSEEASGAALWDDASVRALAICVVMLLALLYGYTLAAGTRLARRVPELRLPSLEGRTRLAVIALVGIGLLAYAFEMWTYGGYGGYLASLKTGASSGLGKWYIHALATLPAGVGVMLFARRLAAEGRERWRLLEVFVIVVGVIIVLSYMSKTAIAIPLLTALLCLYFVRRRAVFLLGVMMTAFAVVTPLVYVIRDEGKLKVSEIATGDYWSVFLANLQSRFFHFESLMVAIPFPSSQPFWQPFADFFGNIVPRVLWEGKPLSVNARFTEEYLKGNLHSPNDVGVISLPGELWLVSGWTGILIVGLVFGILLRLAHALLARSTRQGGTVLLAATLVTGLVFANDGWGLASTFTYILIAGAGWLVFLRPVRRERYVAAGQP
jgi:hypothetical protein